MLKIGLVQMHISSDKILNLNNAEKHIKELSQKGAEIVVLPEIFNSPYDTTKFKEYSEKVNEFSFNT